VKTIIIKVLDKPNKRSGKALKQGKVSMQEAFGVQITNIKGGDHVYVDRKTTVRRKK
jgi:hypothetical protein